MSNLFLVRMSLTSLVMLAKLPGSMSSMMLLVRLSESNLGWVLKAPGRSFSAKGADEKIELDTRVCTVF